MEEEDLGEMDTIDIIGIVQLLRFVIRRPRAAGWLVSRTFAWMRSNKFREVR